MEHEQKKKEHENATPLYFQPKHLFEKHLRQYLVLQVACSIQAHLFQTTIAKSPTETFF